MTPLAAAFSEPYFSEERIVFREKAPNLEKLVQLFRSEAPLLIPSFLWIRSKMIDDSTNHTLIENGKISFSRLHESLCDYDHPVSYWPSRDDLGRSIAIVSNVM